MQDVSIYRSDVLVLTGEEGRKAFEQIKNAPRVPYEKLKKESEEYEREFQRLYGNRRRDA